MLYGRGNRALQNLLLENVSLRENVVKRSGAPCVKWVTVAKTVPSARYIHAMSLNIRLLGTSASRPTIERNVSSLAIHREGETLMFDCGEGTATDDAIRVSFALEDIFTHMHSDHLLGVIGLMRTMALQGRIERLRLWGPRGSAAC